MPGKAITTERTNATAGRSLARHFRRRTTRTTASATVLAVFVRRWLAAPTSTVAWSKVSAAGRQYARGHASGCVAESLEQHGWHGPAANLRKPAPAA